ncbi:MAG: DMT family transporter, partial [Acidimicrobiia bacterium]
MEHAMRPGRGYALFAAAVTLGGSNFLAVRLSNRELDPFWGAGLRFTLAAAIFVLIVLALRLPWPRGKQLMLTIANGLLGISIFYAPAYWALVRVTAGTATIVLALVPLVTLLLASAQRLEHLSARAVGGSLLAVAGISWIAIGPGQVTLSIFPLLALLGATVCASESVIVAKMISANHPAVTNAISFATGAATLLAVSALTGEQWALPAQTEVVLALGYLVT